MIGDLRYNRFFERELLRVGGERENLKFLCVLRNIRSEVSEGVRVEDGVWKVKSVVFTV